MTSNKLMCLDAEADKGNEAVVSFSFQLEPLVKDFLAWSKERNITLDNLDYAFIRQCRKYRKAKTLCILIPIAGNGCIIVPEKKEKIK